MPKFFDPQNSPRVTDIQALPSSSSNKNSPIFKKRNPFSRKNIINTEPKTRKESIPRQSQLSRSLVLAVIAFVILGGGMIVSNLSSFRKDVMGSLEQDIDRLRNQTSNFNLLEGIDPVAKPEAPKPLNPSDPIEEFGVRFWPLLKSSFSTYENFAKLADQVAELLTKADSLSSHALARFFGGQGELLIKELEDINQVSKSVLASNASLTASAAELKDFSITDLDFYLPFQADLARYQKFLESLIGWLKSPGEKHLLVMLLNPSEIRPGGGFLGSYADLVIEKGSLKSIAVHDVNDIDNSLNLKMVPPKPVQAIASRFKTADANWFFDFPSSARQVLQFAESSNLYAKDQIAFDGALAVSADLVGDLLSLTGPIKIEDPNITITEESFLAEIQKEVQTKRESNDSYPKRVLKNLAPVLVEKLTLLDSAKKQAFLGLVGDWVQKKDLIIYFDNLELQKLVENIGASGAVYDLPQDFMGQYLSVVNANLGGGKTDIFIDQNIHLISQVNEDGTVQNHLSVLRDHRGDEGKYWWYKVTNQNYLQVFTTKGARLDNFSGGVSKKITAPLNYSKSGYIVNPLISEIESTIRDFLNYPAVFGFEAFGKGIFATWTKTEAGGQSEIIFDYTSRLPSSLKEGKTFQFIFEKQPGSAGNYKFEIGAPIGFVWQENNLPIFEYDSSDPPGRLILNLTLKKAE